MPGKQSVGFVYFVEALEVGRIKIGYSATDPEAGRFWDLSTASPVALVLIGSIPGTVETERSLHARFRKLRHRGEWFAATDELRQFIAERPDLIRPRLAASQGSGRRKRATFEERTRRIAHEPGVRVEKPKKERRPRWTGDPEIDIPAMIRIRELFGI